MKTSSSRSPLQRASGESRVVFERRDGRTRLADLYQRDPCRVLFPVPEPGEPPQAVMITTSGGVTDGDSLTMAVDIGPGAEAVATTQAAEKVYRAAKGGGHCGIEVRLAVAAGATLEWLPQETIVFDGARLASTTRLELAGDAAACAWEIVCLGRPAAGEGWTHGEARFGFEVFRDGVPLLLERTPCLPGSPLLHAAWGLGGHVAFGTLVATGACSERLARLRESLGSADRLGLTHCDDLLVARYRGPDAAEARRLFTAIWRDWRTAGGGEAPAPPRVWAT